jgi:endonuclease YncB( thermonuclease family)
MHPFRYEQAKMRLLVGTFAAFLLVSCSGPATSTRQVNAPSSPSPRSETRLTRTAPASTFSARVVSIEDGDTIIVLGATNQSHKIRLHGIDAPEGGQAFGNRSHQNLSDLIFGRDVTIEWSKRDRYGRKVGKVLLDGSDICLEQIKSGMAWHYKYYQSEQSKEDRELYANAETNARTTRRGLWSDTDPIPPWDFRRGH